MRKMRWTERLGGVASKGVGCLRLLLDLKLAWTAVRDGQACSWLRVMWAQEQVRGRAG